MEPDAPPTWRRLALRPAWVLVLSLLVLNATGWVVDATALQREADSWGYLFAAFFLSVYALPIVLVVLVAAGLSRVVDRPREQAACAWIGSVAGALGGLALAVLALPTLLASPAGAVFGVVALGVALVLLWPLSSCVCRVRQPEAAS